MSQAAVQAEQDASDLAPRDSGIDVVGPMRWGSHVCLFYQTREDLLGIMADYFAAGLRDHEFCIWAISDQLTEREAIDALRPTIADFDRHREAGAIELLPGRDWFLTNGEPDLARRAQLLLDKMRGALARGFEGMRASGNAFWTTTRYFNEICEHEHMLDRTIAGQRVIGLCTYPLRQSRASDLVDVARAHRGTLIRRNGRWEALDSPALVQARQEIRQLASALDVLSKPFPGRELLTPRERMTLAQIIRGASSKEAARTLGISPRTVEFHRANVLQKLRAKNTADLIRKVLGE